MAGVGDGAGQGVPPPPAAPPVVAAPDVANLQNTIQQLQAQLNVLQNQVQNQHRDETFVSNPYQANINPSTSTGLKMYQIATAKRDALLNPRIKTKKDFLDAMTSDSVSFGWGKFVNKIRVGAQEFSILSDVQKLDVEKVRGFTSQFLYARLSTAAPPSNHNRVMYDIDPENNDGDKEIFYARVRMNMIGERIWNSLNQVSQTNLHVHSKKYTWKDSDGAQLYDGPTMLQILVQTINPSTMVGISTLKDKIRSITLPGFHHNVVDMFSHQSRIYNEILQLGKTHDDLMYDTFKSLSTTNNEEFEMFVKDLKGKWETDTNEESALTHDELVEKCTAKYNNLVDQKAWNTNNTKNAKLVALATQVKTLEQKLADSTNNSTSNRNTGGPNKSNRNGKFGGPLPAWRLTKSLGDKTERDGLTWYWCHHQHNNGKGMYVTHKPEDHTSWLERKNKSKENRNKSKSGTQAPNDNSLQLQDKLKAALVTKFKCSESEATTLLESVDKSN